MESTRPTLWVLPFTVTLTTPVAPAVTLISILAISSTSIVTSFNSIIGATLFTLYCFKADELALYLSLPVNVATTFKVALFKGV